MLEAWIHCYSSIIMIVDTNGEDFDHSIMEHDLPEFQCGRARKISLERRYRIEL